MLLIEYPKCSTCQKAKKYLDSNNINYSWREINQPNGSDLIQAIIILNLIFYI